MNDDVSQIDDPAVHAPPTPENANRGLPKKTRPYFTVEQYLAIERASLDKHEYIDGEIYAMAGESLNHGYISPNLIAALVTQLKGKNCSTLAKDMKVRSGPVPEPPLSTKGLYSYPDIVIVCGKPEFHDDKKDVILNPTVVVEVLSPFTEAFDRGEKFSRYQTWNPTLRDYLLVSQDQPQIDHFTRPKDDDGWFYRRSIGLEASVAIASIECVLILLDVYDRVEFEA